MAAESFGFGILGTGKIARVVAEAIAAASSAHLAAVSSRSQANAEAFAADFRGAEPLEGLEAMLALESVQAVYVAIPTAFKEAAALAAIAAGKHVLVDKPFVSAESVRRMTGAAAAAGLVFMDATHFVHHPRRDALRAAVAEKVGRPKALHTVFYSDTTDRNNIRMRPDMEPMGALGDVGWYCMRSMVEYLRPEGALARVSATCQRDPGTGAVLHCTGLMEFEGGQSATFGCAFESGTAADIFSLYGQKGAILVDDFVVNWTNSFLRKLADVPTGFTHRKGTARPTGADFIETPSDTPQQVLMVENFQALARSGDAEARAAFARATEQTQSYLDAAWKALA